MTTTAFHPGGYPGRLYGSFIGKEASIVVPVAPAVEVYGTSGYWPSPKRRTKKELDDERRERLGLSVETIEAVAEVPKARRKLVLADIIGKQRAAQITSVDLSEAIAATKRRKRRQEDELLLMM